ncbi:hypothetical protein AOLI_G00307350 [Acnodon oligacanthus]
MRVLASIVMRPQDVLSSASHYVLQVKKHMDCGCVCVTVLGKLCISEKAPTGEALPLLFLDRCRGRTGALFSFCPLIRGA